MFDEPKNVWDTDTFELFNMYAILRDFEYDWHNLSYKMREIKVDLMKRDKYLVVYFDAGLSRRLRSQQVLPDNHVELFYAAPSIIPIQYADGAVVVYPKTIKVIKNRSGFGTWNNLFLKLSVREKLNASKQLSSMPAS